MTFGVQRTRFGPRCSSTSSPAAGSPAGLWVRRCSPALWDWCPRSCPPLQICLAAQESESAPRFSPADESPLRRKRGNNNNVFSAMCQLIELQRCQRGYFKTLFRQGESGDAEHYGLCQYVLSEVCICSIIMYGNVFAVCWVFTQRQRKSSDTQSVLSAGRGQRDQTTGVHIHSVGQGLARLLLHLVGQTQNTHKSIHPAVGIILEATAQRCLAGSFFLCREAAVGKLFASTHQVNDGHFLLLAEILVYHVHFWRKHHSFSEWNDRLRRADLNFGKPLNRQRIQLRQSWKQCRFHCHQKYAN